MTDCRGCIGNLHKCYYIEGAKEFECPCGICLVKVTCETICDDFHDFAKLCEEKAANEEKKRRGKH